MTLLEQYKMREAQLLQAHGQLQAEMLRIEGAIRECREMMAQAEQGNKGGNAQGVQGPLNPSKARRKKASV